MTSRQEQISLQEKLREVLGNGPAATLISMLPHDDLATKADVSEVRLELSETRAELKGEITGLRTEIGRLRTEMESRYATKDDLLAVVNGFNETMSGHVRGFNEMMAGYVRTFIVVQAATVVGMSAILFGLLRLG